MTAKHGNWSAVAYQASPMMSTLGFLGEPAVSPQQLLEAESKAYGARLKAESDVWAFDGVGWKFIWVVAGVVLGYGTMTAITTPGVGSGLLREAGRSVRRRE